MQETQQRQNRSRWELIKDALNKDFTSRSDLKARFALVFFFFLYTTYISVIVVPWQSHAVAALHQNSQNLTRLNKFKQFVFQFPLRY